MLVGVGAGRADRHADAGGFRATEQGLELGHRCGRDYRAEFMVRKSPQARGERRCLGGLQETHDIQRVLVADSVSGPGAVSNLWTLATSSAAGLATSITTDRSSPQWSDVISMCSRSTSAPSRPLARRAALRPWGPRRAPLVPAPATASGTMRSKGIPSGVVHAPGCSLSRNPCASSNSAMSGASLRSVGTTQRSASSSSAVRARTYSGSGPPDMLVLLHPFQHLFTL